MTDIYGNITYPASRRIYSRPYANYIQYKETAAAYAVLRYTLHDVGRALIGSPFYTCCDLDKLSKNAYFFPPFWNQKKIIELAARKDVLDMWHAEVRDAIKNIASQCARVQGLVDAGKTPFTSQPFDMPSMIRDFKTLWNHDIMTDPRLTFAEEIFFCQKDELNDYWGGYWSVDEDSDHGRRERARLTATLEWMAQPGNATAVAPMFVYSRVAQHAETDQFSVVRLVTSRYDLADDSNLEEKLKEYKVKNIKEFMNSWYSMIRDYNRLVDGSWAKETLAKVRAIDSGFVQISKPQASVTQTSAANTPAPAVKVPRVGF